MLNRLYSLLFTFGQGGVINGIIFFVCFVTLYIGLGKLFQYLKFQKEFPSLEDLSAIHTSGVISEKLSPRFRDCFSGISQDDLAQRDPRFFMNRYRELLIGEVDNLESGLVVMGAWVSVAPLLGLLGTVAGMMKTFSVITTYGIGNPTLLSEGISLSLITTQTGLLVAFPGLLFHSYLTAKKESLVHRLITDGERALSLKGERS